MGQIKTRFIKSFGEELIEKYPDKFSIDFKKDKKVLNKLGVTASKKVRNKIAGYLVHIIRKKKYQPLQIPYYQKTNRRKRRVKRYRRRR